MLARLWYAGLVLVCAAAVRIGLWPSLLTLGALAALPLGILAVIGVISPALLGSRPRLLSAVRWGAYALSAELLLVGGWSTWDRRRAVTLVVYDPVPRVVRIVYDVRDGTPVRRLSWNRRFDVPSSGTVYTRYGMDFGWYAADNPHPLTVLKVSTDGDTTRVPGSWLRGGFARGLGCGYFHDEFLVGPDSVVDEAFGERPVSWLDSTSTWGVACDGERLRRESVALGVPSPRPSEVCRYVRDGGMHCWSGPAP